MKRERKSRVNRLLAMWLCLCLFLSSTAQAATVRETGSVEKPLQFPAEGYIHAEISRTVKAEGDGFGYTTQETYIPVAVSQDQTVYAHLDFLAGKLDMKVSYFGQTARLDTYESAVLMKLGDREYGYVNSLYQFCVEGTAAPALFNGAWYVPLDAVLNMTGCEAVYTKEDVRGKKILSLALPQRDLEDELALFYRNRSRYPFSYAQLGYSEQIAEEMKEDRFVQQFLYRLGSLKPEALMYAIVCIGDIPAKKGGSFPRDQRAGAETFDREMIMENMYLDAYMECLLREDEAILQETVKETLENTDQFVAVAEMLSDANGLSDDKLISRTKSVLEAYTDINMKKLDGALKTAGTLDRIYTPAKWLTGILFTRYQYENSSRFEVEAAKEFFECKDEIVRLEVNPSAPMLRQFDVTEDTQEYLGDYQYSRIEKIISAYDLYTTEAAVYSEYYEEHPVGLSGDALLLELKKNVDATVRYCIDNAITLPYSVLGWLGVREKLLGAAAGKALGVVALVSSVWEWGGKVFFGEELNAGESFLAGAFGVTYQKDSMAVITGRIESIRNGWNTDPDRTQLRDLLYHAAKSCLAAGKMGCDACEGIIGAGNEAFKRQEEIQEELTQMCARLKRTPYVIYRTPSQYDSLIDVSRDHAPNVLYNIVELSGQVLDWENEAPAANVRIEITSEEGAVLAEAVTDKEGRFVSTVQMELVDLESDEPVNRPLTLHMFYKKYPEVLESIQVECFHKYEVEGLHVGYRKENKLVYLIGAREENRKTVVDALEIFLAEDCIYLEVPDWNGDVYPTYGPMPGEMELASDMISLQLDKGLAIHTVYNQVMPSDDLMGQLMGELYREYIPEVEPLLQDELRTASDIQSFIDTYCDINGEYPAFKVSTVNSIIKDIDAVFVVAPSGEGLGVPEKQKEG